MEKSPEKSGSTLEEELTQAAEALIVKGKERGYLTPDDILESYPQTDAEPDQVFRIFAAFNDIGIEVRRQQDELVRRLGQLFPEARAVDRRRDPSYGYRAVHLVVRAQGRQVEVQIRTELQDRWANVVERLSDDFRVDLKHGHEAPDGFTLGWLMRGSDCLERVEREEDPQLFGGDMNLTELSLFRRGQFNGVMLLAPYIRELSDEAVPADI